MIIECYKSECPEHSCHTPGEEGPFCYAIQCIEEKCTKMINCIYSNAKEQCLHKNGIKRFFTGQCGMTWKRPCPAYMETAKIEEDAFISAPILTAVALYEEQINSPDIFEKIETESLNFFEDGSSGGGGASRNFDEVDNSSYSNDSGSNNSSSNSND